MKLILIVNTVFHRTQKSTFFRKIGNLKMQHFSKHRTRVVPIPIPVSENASDTADIAGINIVEYASLCTDLIPCDLLAA